MVLEVTDPHSTRDTAYTILTLTLMFRTGCKIYLPSYQNIRIFIGLEKGTCAPNNHEQAFVQREETKD